QSARRRGPAQRNSPGPHFARRCVDVYRAEGIPLSGARIFILHADGLLNSLSTLAEGKNRTRMHRWYEYSKDPNAPELMRRRRMALAKARAARLVNDRVAYLCQLVAGKSILDIGVVEHTREAVESPQWLHGNLKRHAAQCLGVDVLEKEVRYLQTKGYK